jgi:hypothetical protein
VCGSERGFAILTRLRQGRAMIRRALTNTGWLMGARGINAVLSLGYLALATRALGLEGFGKFVLAVSFSQALTGLASFQTWQAVVRWGHGRDDPADAVGFALALDLVTVAAGSVAAGLLLYFAGDWLPVPPALRTEAFWLTVVSLLAVRSTPTGILRLHDHYALAATADAVTPVVRLVGAAGVFLFAQTSAAFVIVWGVAEVATALTYWRFALRDGPLPLRQVSLRRLPRAEKDAWRFVWGTRPLRHDPDRLAAASRAAGGRAGWGRAGRESTASPRSSARACSSLPRRCFGRLIPNWCETRTRRARLPRGSGASRSSPASSRSRSARSPATG